MNNITEDDIKQNNPLFYYRRMLQAMACQLDENVNPQSTSDIYRKKSIRKLEQFITELKDKVSQFDFIFEIGRAVQYVDDKFDKEVFNRQNYPYFIKAMNMFRAFGINKINAEDSVIYEVQLGVTTDGAKNPDADYDAPQTIVLITTENREVTIEEIENTFTDEIHALNYDCVYGITLLNEREFNQNKDYYETRPKWYM